jgi:hypothetical protein
MHAFAHLEIWHTFLSMLVVRLSQVSKGACLCNALKEAGMGYLLRSSVLPYNLEINKYKFPFHFIYMCLPLCQFSSASDVLLRLEKPFSGAQY